MPPRENNRLTKDAKGRKTEVQALDRVGAQEKFQSAKYAIRLAMVERGREDRVTTYCSMGYGDCTN